MKKGSIMAAFALLGSLVAAGPASAGFVAGGDQIVTVSGNPEATYHVTVVQEDSTNVYDVTVSFVSQPVAPPPNAFLDDIKIEFLSGLNGTGTVENAVANAGSTNNASPGSTAPWFIQADFGNAAEWQVPSASPPVGGDPGSNPQVVNFMGDGSVFFGTAVVSGPVESVQSTLSNSGGSTDTFNNVPEASSLALIVPGLLPLGYAMRRRFSRT